ncbi:MAG: DUF2306 domain-containing protein [Caldilineaceae bacterium]
MHRLSTNLFANMGWSLMSLLVIGIALASSRYFTLNPAVYFPEQRAVYTAHTLAILGHISGSLVALLLGPFQFLPRLRRQRWLGIHRWSGRVYLIGITVGGLFGLYVAQMAYGGVITHLGFTGLALFWLYTGYQAYRAIRRGDIQTHKRWMFRNYAATFAAVTLRLWLPLSMALGIDFTLAYRTIAWLSWVPNVLIIEWWLQQRQPLPRKVLQYQ